MLKTNLEEKYCKKNAETEILVIAQETHHRALLVVKVEPTKLTTQLHSLFYFYGSKPKLTQLYRESVWK